MQFITGHWQEVAVALVIAGLTAGFRTLWKRVKTQKDETDAVKEGVKSLLHDRLYQACTHYVAQGWIDTESLHNLDYLYNAYHRLGGNGTGTNLYNRAKALPLNTDQRKEENYV